MRYSIPPLLFLAAVSHAAPPTIATIAPRGIERGKPTEIVITGTNLSPETSLWTAFEADVKRLPDKKPNPTQARFLVTSSPGAPIGFFLVRAFGPEGVSAPAPFAIDPFPGIVEKEDNNTFEKAQPVPLPVVIDGQCAGGDIDFFRFPAKKGQRLVIETEAARLGSGLVPHLRLTDGKGRFLASDDSQRVRGDGRILFTVPADGDYIIEFSDSRYRGANPPQYRLKIGDYDVAEEVFPLGFHRKEATSFTLRGGNLEKDRPWDKAMKDLQGFYFPGAIRLYAFSDWKEGMAWAEVLAGPYRHRHFRGTFPGELKRLEDEWQPPFTVQGRFDKAREIHRFQLDVKEEQRLRFIVQAQALGSYLDGQLRITDEKGKLLAQSDDVDVPAAAAGQQPYKSMDPALEFAVPEGVSKLNVELRDALGRGGINFGYLLTIEPAVPDLKVNLRASEVNVPRGGFAVVPVGVVRRGYDGPIQLECNDLPPGWTVHGGFVPEKATAGALLVQRVDPSPTPTAPLFVSILGKSLEGPPLQDSAEFRFLVSKEVNPAVSTVVLDKLALGLDAPPPFRLEGQASVDLVLGLQKKLSVNITWAGEIKEPFPAVEISAFGLGDGGKPIPGGVSVMPGNIAPGMKSGDLKLLAPVAMPEGRTHDLILQAKAKVAGKDVTVVGPGLRVQIHRPFELVLDEKHSLKPGQPYVLKGTLKRHADFREPVQLKLDGLPAGVTAAPIKPVQGDQSAFAIELKVDAKANPAMTSPTLTATSTIGGMSYTHPPHKLSAAISPGAGK